MKTFQISVRVLAVFTILTGLLYTLAVTGAASLLFPRLAGGSTVQVNGKTVGAELIAQKFASAKYFWPRPSGVDYNPLPSGATNLGPSSAELQKAIKERTTLGLSGDMLFASASGLDPHISPASALRQMDRVASARRMNDAGKKRLVELVMKRVEGRQFGFLGEERINVLLLNIALDIEFGNG